MVVCEDALFTGASLFFFIENILRECIRKGAIII